MKNFIFGLCLPFFIIAVSLTEALAQQNKSTDQYFQDGGRLTDKLWYGAGFNLGFSGSNFISIFGVGVSPMVGYKVFDEFSVGPRVSFDYQAIRVQSNTNAVVKANPVSYSFGLFSRLKLFNISGADIFTHLEFELENEGNIVDEMGRVRYDSNNNILVNRVSRDNLYAGLGYNSNTDGAGPWGFELLALYNFNEPQNSIYMPITFRAGFTYNF